MGLKKIKDGFMRSVRMRLALCNKTAMLFGASVLILCGVVVRLISGSPYRFGMMLRFESLIPPVWVMTLLWMAWYGILGATFANVLCTCTGSFASESEKYRGGMTFLCMIFLGFCWYPLFFAAARLFLSALVVLLVLFFCILTAITYWKNSVARGAGVVLFIHAAFLIWMFVLNLTVAFHG